jgi:hypothetical protein
MRCKRIRRGVFVVLLVIGLAGLSGCNRYKKKQEIEQPPASEELMAQADEAWQAKNFDRARQFYSMVAESYIGDPNREEAILRLALMDVVLPGEGPDVEAALQKLAGMDLEGTSTGSWSFREALIQLLELHRGDREAIRMLLDQNRRLEAQVAGREVEAIHRKASLYQWRLDVGRANQRVEQLEVELEKIRHEIKLLKEIDMMLQTEAGGQRPKSAETSKETQKKIQ